MPERFHERSVTVTSFSPANAALEAWNYSHFWRSLAKTSIPVTIALCMRADNPIEDGLPSEREIRQQLGAILATPPFCRSPRVSAFLRFVVEETMANPERALKQYTVALAVFDLSPGFSPEENPIVRVQAGRVRRALRRYYEGSGTHDPVRIAIPLGSYVPSFAYRQAENPVHEDLRDLSLATPDGMPTIAVLRPIDRSETPLPAHLLDGMAEELVGQISRFPMVRALAYRSSSQLHVSAIGEDAGQNEFPFNYALSSTIQEDADVPHLGFHLVRSSDQIEIWSRRIDGGTPPLRSALVDFGVIVKMANQVAGTFGAVHKSAFRPNIETSRATPDAYEAIMAFHHFQLTMSIDGFALARRLLSAALAHTPENPLVLAMLGMLMFDAHVFGFAEIEDALSKGMALANKAKCLDPCSQHVHHTMAYAAMLDGDTDGVSRAAETIVDLNPNNAYMMGAASFWFSIAGKHARAAALLLRSKRLDPFHPAWFHFGPFLEAFGTGDYRGALGHARDFALPDFYWSHIMTCASLHKLGDGESARAAYRQIERHRPAFAETAPVDVGMFVLDPRVRSEILDSLRVSRGC